MGSLVFLSWRVPLTVVAGRVRVVVSRVMMIVSRYLCIVGQFYMSI